MATAALQIPASNHVLPGSCFLRTAPFPNAQSAADSSDPSVVVTKWVSSFNSLLQGKDVSTSEIFLKESCWRDLLCMTWDFHTLQGPEQTTQFIKSSPAESRITNLSVPQNTAHKTPSFAQISGLKVIQSFLKVETSAGRGQGLVRLVSDPSDGGKWKVFTLFTTLEELKGFEEHIFSRRPTGLRDSLDNGNTNWKDRLNAQQNFENGREPTVLILGAGQGGLTIAARLKQMGIEALIIDRNARVGDNWRNRYHQLVLHDSVWYDHMPYLNFPPNWPIFSPKDKLADWFEYYAGVLELNIWTSTNLTTSKWDDRSRQWTATISREKMGRRENRTFHPRHIILATGHSGEPYFPSQIKGLNDFKGDCLIHSSRFTEPKPDGEGKKAVVVGCCNSGHDIARDYYQHGYDVTIVQRSSTLVATCESLLDVTMSGLYDESGPPVDDADIINMSIPNPVNKRLHTEAHNEVMRRDGALLRDLGAAGFSVDSGPDGSGLFMKYLSRGGGYYIDVGTSRLIADRKIKIKQGQEIKAVKAHSIAFTDDSELEADEIVFATGYQNMKESARKIFGNEVADRVHEVWGFDEEGETRGMWRRSGHPGFWFFGGNLALCRFYSRLLALQIKAIEVGLVKA